jgi:hypothetical protein
MSKKQKTHGDPTLPHPDVQKTLLDMKAKGMLEPEMLQKIRMELKRELVIQEAIEENPGLTREEASEMLEDFGFNRPKQP